MADSPESSNVSDFEDVREAIFQRVFAALSEHQRLKLKNENRHSAGGKSTDGNKTVKTAAIAAGGTAAAAATAGGIAVASAGGTAATAGGAAIGASCGGAAVGAAGSAALAAGDALAGGVAALAVEGAGAATVATGGTGLLAAVGSFIGYLAAPVAVGIGIGVVGSSLWRKRKKGKWERLQFLGRGQFGEVYVCKNVESGQQFALKSVPLCSKENTDFLRNEIEKLSKADHPNILKYVEVEETESDISMIMELMRCSVGQLLREKPFRENAARVISNDVLNGISYLHKNGILHRDIKGDNVLVDGSGNAKLADFGTSKCFKNQSDAVTTTKNIAATLCFMPPEMALDNKQGKKSDIWAFACAVYEMLTGSPLYCKCTPGEIMKKLQNLEHRNEIRNCGLPSSAKDFINSMLVPYENRPDVDEVKRHEWLNNFSVY